MVSQYLQVRAYPECHFQHLRSTRWSAVNCLCPLIIVVITCSPIIFLPYFAAIFVNTTFLPITSMYPYLGWYLSPVLLLKISATNALECLSIKTHPKSFRACSSIKSSLPNIAMLLSFHWFCFPGYLLYLLLNPLLVHTFFLNTQTTTDI